MSGDPLIITFDKQRYPLQRGAFLETLQALGVSTDDALSLTQKTVHVFKGNKPVSSSAFNRYVKEQLEHLLTPNIALRYLSCTPPFLPILILSKGRKTPLAQRQVVQELEKHNIRFKDAHFIAQRLEQTLRLQGIYEIQQERLKEYIATQIETHLGQSARNSYERTPLDICGSVVTEANGQRFPFSRGILARSLVGVGLEIELAHQIARIAENQLRQLGTSTVQRHELRELVSTLLHEQAGELFAQRYNLMHNVRHSEQPFVILLSGSAGVGKSTLAAELAYRLGASRIVSSDSIRQALRSLISADLSPVLHSSSFNAWQTELLPGESVKPRPKRVLRTFQTQVQQISTALTAILQRNISEGLSVVMEGIHVVPGFISAETLHDAVMIELAVIQPNKDNHRRNFEQRGGDTRQQRRAERYLQHFYEIRLLQDFIIEQAQNESVPIIDLSNFDEGLEHALDVILNTLLGNDLLSHSDLETPQDALALPDPSLPQIE